MRLLILPAVLSLLCAAGCDRAPHGVERAMAYNPAVAPGPWPPAELDLPGRVGWWARQFLAAEETTYCFGPAAGGYVAEGRLVLDEKHDCISLLYRTTELARSEDPRQAVAVALATRFAGADPDSVVGADGRVDYDHPAHLDYSVDMIRSGHWGVDHTAGFTGAHFDTVGTPRYPPGFQATVDEDSLVAAELREGDVLWLVLDPENAGARALREDHGLMIGHVGLVILEDGEPWLVHAASSGLPGRYEGGRVVAVPVAEYLHRVERYGAVMVTRLAGN